MTQKELSKRIERSKWLAIALFAIVVAAYVLRFWVQLKTPFSTNSEAWGQFGDYVGGLLNPVIAFLAFYWLTQSILLQKEELTATKEALQESAVAQSKTAKINALSALLASHNNDISNLRDNIEFVGGQLRLPGPNYSPQGLSISDGQAQDLLAEMNAGLQSALLRRLNAMDEVTALLREQNV